MLYLQQWRENWGITQAEKTQSRMGDILDKEI